MTFKEELIEVLKEELKALRILKDLTYEKTDIIISNQVEILEEITKREEELINRMAIAEEQRLYLMDSWGVGINLSLSQVIKNVPEDKEDLIEMKEELTQILEDIKTRNNTNNELINENLQWLDFNMNLISNIQTPVTYGKESKGRGANNSLFDRKV